MNDLETRIQKMSKNSIFLSDEDKSSEEFFLTCIRLGRFDLAVACDDKFITKEFI